MSAPLLAAYDGHRAAPVRLGRLLATTLELPLHVASAYRFVPVDARVPDPVTAHGHAAADERLEALADRIGLDDDVVRETLPAEDVPAELLHLARLLEAAAVVVGPDERGHVTRELLREAACPVVVAPADDLLVPSALRAVGVAYDGSPGSRCALEAARTLAVRAGARLELVAVAPDAADAARLHDTLAAAALPIGDVDVRWTLLPGGVASGLRRACERLDLLACGSRGRGPVLSSVLGSVSARLVDAPPCPVLVTPVHARRAPGAPLGVSAASSLMG